MSQTDDQVEGELTLLSVGQKDKTLYSQKPLGLAYHGPKDEESWEFRCDQELLSQFKAGAEAKL